MNDVTKYVGFGDGENLEVYNKYAVEQAENGDERLMLAPIAGNKGECLYIETNGDPLVIAIRETGSEEWQENIARFIGTDRLIVDLERDDMEWIARVLEE